MPAMCARCGAQNPDGNLYCQSCGTPLMPAPGGVATAVAPSAIPGPPPGPPPGFAPPAAAPGGYQSPYYAPVGPGVPVQRTPWTLIVAGVVVLILVMAGAGTVLALAGNHNNASTPTHGLTSELPSPSPGGTPSPVASPVSTSATTESNSGVSVTVPPGWTVQAKDNETIILTDPDSTGSVTVASGPSSPAASAQDNKNQIDGYFKTNYPDARTCPNTTTTNTTFNGVGGISWVLCFTVTSGAQSVAGAASLFVGANGGGSVYYLAMVVSRQSNLQSFLTLVKPVLQSVHWKLS
jgi:hypothetical protein